MADPAPIEHSPTPDTSGLCGHPRGLTVLFFTELWERFSYYGMRALLTIFMVTPVAGGGFGYLDRKATTIYGNYLMSVYLLSILGGFIADNFIGSRFAVLCGGLVIVCGHFSMALPSETTFFLGLGLIALGTGLLKPNISTMVGSLYAPEDERRDAGFSIFYMGINIGAFAAPLVTGYLAQYQSFKDRLTEWGFDPLHSWHWGFGAAGVGMTLGLVIYVWQRRHLAQVGNPPSPAAPKPWGKLGLVALGTAALMAVMVASDYCAWLIYLIFGAQIAALIYFALRPDRAGRRLAAILVFCLAAEIFWAVFEQAGSTIALFGERLTRLDTPLLNLKTPLLHLTLGGVFPSAYFQSVNSLFVILLAPAFAWLWIKLGSRQPSSPCKFAAGLIFLGLSFVLMVPAARLTVAGRVSPLWIVGLFFLQTLGEMCLSPVGLSTMTKLAPPKLAGLVMGVWFLATALGNKLAGVLAGGFTAFDAGALAGFFWHQALAVGAGALALLALMPWLKKLMDGVR